MENRLNLPFQKPNHWTSNSIDKLVKGFYSNGIKWKKIGDFFIESFAGNKEVTKKVMGTGNFPCINCWEIYLDHEIWFNKCNFFISASLVKNPKYVNYGNIVLPSTSKVSGDIGVSCAYLGKEKAIAGKDLIVFSHNQNPKYISYALSTDISKLQKLSVSVIGATHTHIYSSGLKKIKIPLPPLELQEKIAEVLDRLRLSKNELIRRLKEEIENREKQYEYYRDSLILS